MSTTKRKQLRADTVILHANPKLRTQLTYPLAKLRAALSTQGLTIAYDHYEDEPIDLHLQLTDPQADEANDGYILSQAEHGYVLRAENRRGLIYGLHDGREQIQYIDALEYAPVHVHGQVEDISQSVPIFR